MLKTALDDKLYLAPIDNFQRVLDIGTGTGIWAIEMGDLFPQAEFLGNDLSPVQPSWVPPNVKFEVDDVEDRWAYGAPHDFIFCRSLSFAVGDFPKLMKQAFRNVRKGGWVEFQDFNVALYAEDGSYKADSDTAKYMHLLMDSARKAGKEPCAGPKLEGWIKEAGFVNVNHRKIKLPVGPWPKDRRQVCKFWGIVAYVQALRYRLAWQRHYVLMLPLLSTERRRTLQPDASHRRPRSIRHAAFHHHVGLGP
jgi:SAM-dependent methyltransferase